MTDWTIDPFTVAAIIIIALGCIAAIWRVVVLLRRNAPDPWDRFRGG